MELSQIFKHEGFVRKYICKKYSLRPEEFNAMLFMHAQRNITVLEFSQFAKATKWRPALMFILKDKGLIHVTKKKRYFNKIVYSATKHLDKIVVEFFELLTMAKSFSLREATNPLLQEQREYRLHYNSLYMQRFNQQREQLRAPGSRKAPARQDE